LAKRCVIYTLSCILLLSTIVSVCACVRGMGEGVLGPPVRTYNFVWITQFVKIIWK